MRYFRQNGELIMTKQLWINLPVKNLNKSKEFFVEIGFALNPHYDREEAVSLLIGDKDIVVMLFPEETFNNFTGSKITDTTLSNEVLLSFDAESKEEVDELAKKVVEAGGTLYGEPGGDDWMYGCGFQDLDGHRWNVLYMDMSNMTER